jgi:replicative DNA helicase
MIYQVDKLPSQPEAERMALGCVLLDNGLAPQVLYQTDPEDYSVESHRMVFLAMRAIDRGDLNGNRAINPLTLQAELTRAGNLERVGGPASISALFDGVPRFSDVSSYVRLIKDASALRKSAHLANWLFNESLANDVRLDEMLSLLRTKVDELTEQQTADDLISSETAIERAMGELERRWESGGDVVGLPSGFPDLDKALLGFRGGKYYTLAAGTGIGKTTLALNFGQRIVSEPGPDGPRVGLIISLEMPTDELMVKTLSTFTQINSYRIETGHLTDQEKGFVREKAEEIRRLPLEYVEGFSKVTANSLVARVAKVRRKYKRLDFLIVDYLQLLDSDEKRENEHLRLSEISRTLKRIAIMHNIPVIVLSQLNREFSKRANKDYQLSDLRGSGSIEQDSDVVMFLMPQDWVDEENPGRRLVIAKHRGGRKDVTINLVFFGEQSRFESAAVESYKPEMLESATASGPQNGGKPKNFTKRQKKVPAPDWRDVAKEAGW